MTVRLDKATLRRLAVIGDCDPRSIQKELAHPGSVRGLAGERARAALATYFGQALEPTPGPEGLPS